ncbi:MAG TPA: FHA domain-containing protein [Thermoanaerobaculia bacterium]|nr:FHA domain-containing protein [Thermoanaerobaculia bacterium]
MIIDCPNCHVKYQYDEARFEGKTSKKIRCAKCQQIFDVHNPEAPAGVPPEGFEATMTRRPTRSAPPETNPLQDATASVPIPGSNTDRAASAAKLPQGKRLSLAIIDGPDSGKVFRMEKPRVVIGRSNADFVLNDSESSRAHAAVEARDTLVFLEDLGSTNGTLMDGERVHGTVEISSHTEFQVGSTTLMLIVTDSD